MGPPLNFPPRLRALAKHLKFSGNPPLAPLRFGWIVRSDGWLTDAEKDWLRAAGFVGHGHKWERPDDLSWAAKNVLIPLWGLETREVRQDPPFCDYRAPTEIRRDFTAADVSAFGKSSAWGDFRIGFLVRLNDGAVISINASRQGKDGQRWLRRLARGLPAPIPRRDEWLYAWMDV